MLQARQDKGRKVFKINGAYKMAALRGALSTAHGQEPQVDFFKEAKNVYLDCN